MLKPPDKYVFIGILCEGTTSVVVKPLMEVYIWI